MISRKTPPPYRIETERTVVRCYNPPDASLLKTAIDNNLEHLRPWMPWVLHEPESLASKTERLRTFRGQFDTDIDYLYGIFNDDESLLIGGTGLHPRIGEGAFEIGYWICSNRTNQGIATEVTAALTKVAFDICKVDRVEIHCDPSNTCSKRIPEKLGFVHEATLRRRFAGADGNLQDSMIWTLFADQYSQSKSAPAKVAGFDCVGNKLV